MAEAHKRKRHPKYRKKYKVRNWSEYDRSLRSRGDLTIWLSEDVIDAWVPEQNGKRGRQRKYSDISIEAALSLRLVFHLGLRQTEGFFRVNPFTYECGFICTRSHNHLSSK